MPEGNDDRGPLFPELSRDVRIDLFKPQRASQNPDAQVGKPWSQPRHEFFFECLKHRTSNTDFARLHRSACPPQKALAAGLRACWEFACLPAGRQGLRNISNLKSGSPTTRISYIFSQHSTICNPQSESVDLLHLGSCCNSDSIILKLETVKPPILTIESDQLIVRSLFYNLTFREDDNPVGISDG